MKSYFLCLRRKESDSLQAEKIIFSAAAPFGLKKENCQSYNTAREFFFRFSQISAEEALVIMAVDTEFFVNAKRMVCSVLSIKCAESEAISSLCEPNTENYDVHSSMPVDGVVFPTSDGLFSGFAAKANNLHLVFLPLDEERTPQCMEAFEGYLAGITQKDEYFVKDIDEEEPQGAENPLERAFYELQALLNESKLKAFVSVPSAGAKICSRLPQNEEISYFTSELKRGDNSPKTYGALLAKEAAERSPSNIGASITRAFKVAGDDENGFFVIVAVADSEYAKVKKIYAKPQEPVSSLTTRAAETAFQMLKEYVSSKEAVPNTPLKATTEKVSPSKNKRPWIAGICAAVVIVILCLALGVGYIMARANDESVPSNAEITKDYEDSADDRHGEVELIPDTVYEDITDTQPSEMEDDLADTESTTAKETKAHEESTVKETTTEKTTVPATKEPTTSKPVSDGTFVFTVYGYGHGVGMSQYGANSYAKQGWSYDKILKHYYTGTTVVDDPNMPKTLKVKGKDVETSLAVAMAVQGEMGSSFHTEALKAQAVAAYTYAMRNGGSCDGLYTVSTPSQTVINAVNAVKGKYVSYNGTYINAVFFAYSGGNTVSSASVWGSTVNYPYLVSVDSSSDLKLSNCKTQVRISAAEMKKRAYDSYGVVLTGDPSTWLKIQSHDNSTGVGVGYVSKISMGGKVLSGNQFRTYVMDYNIRSHCFSVEFIPS